MQTESSQDRNGRPLERTSVQGVYRRGSRYVVIYRDPQGVQHKRSARTLAEARDVKAALRADVVRGEYRSTSRLTFAEYARQWIDSYAGRTSRGLRPATRGGYRQTLERDALLYFRRVRLTELEPRHLKGYAAHLAARGLSRNSVRLALAPVKALLATAHEEGLIRSNPAAGVLLAHGGQPSEAGGEKVKALTEEELRGLLDELPQGRRLLFESMAHTGLRISEAIALQWGHVDLGRRRVLVRRRWYRDGYAPPKSKFGRRDVPLTTGMAQRLWALRKEARAGDEALVFPSRAGTPLNAANLYNRVFKPAAERAGVPWATFHTLRHTCATMLFRQGLNAKQVQGWLGHHAASFTIDTYIQLLPDDLPDPSFLDALTGQAAEAEPEPDSRSAARVARAE